MKLFRRISCPKVILWLSNLTLMACACALLVAGGLLYLDHPKLLISKLLGITNESLAGLEHPLFFYVAVGLAGAGLIGLFAAILGCWANCWTNYYTLTLYFLVVFVLLIGEFVFSISISIWPQCLGLNLDEDRMVRELQGKYGIPGHEHFTSAIDLTQTYFHCCGISSDINYDTSFWRIKSHGHKDLTVPLTCCVLPGDNDEGGEHQWKQYLDPKPTNLTLCQSIERGEYSKGRHLKSCLDEIETWYRQHYILFLGIISVVALVHFFVLLSIIYSCTNIKRQLKESIDQHMAEFERKVNDRRSIIAVASSNGSSPVPESFIRQPSLEYNNKPRNLATFRSGGGNGGSSLNRVDYRGQKAYLV